MKGSLNNLGIKNSHSGKDPANIRTERIDEIKTLVFRFLSSFLFSSSFKSSIDF